MTAIPNRLPAKILFGAFAVVCAVLSAKNLVVLVAEAIPGLWSDLTVPRFLVVAVLVALFFAGVVLAFFRLKKSRGNPDGHSHLLVYCGILFLAALCLNLLFTFWVGAPPKSDYLGFYNATNSTARGDFSFVTGTYWRVWSYQSGFPTFMAPVAMLFPENIDALLVFGNLFGAGIVVCVFYLLRKLMPEKRAFLFSLGYLLLPYPYSVGAVFTNQPASAFFLFLGLCFVFSKSPFDLKRCAIGGLCLVVGNVLRPEGVLILVSALIASLVVLAAAIRSGSTIRGRLKRVVPLAVCCAVYLAGNALASGIFAWTGANPGGLGNHFPLYKFAVGLNEKSLGRYSGADTRALFLHDREGDREARDQFAAELIAERLSVGPVRLGSLVWNKLDVVWTDRYQAYPAFSPFEGDHRLHFLGRGVQVGTVKRVFSLFDSLWFVLLFASCAFVGFRLLKAGEIATIMLFVAVFLLSAVAAFSLVEAQRRYAFLLMPAVWIMASNSAVLSKQARH